MIKQYKNNRSVLFLLIIVVASTSLYVVFKNLPIIIGSFRWFWGPIGVAIILATRPKLFILKPHKYSLIFGFFFLGIFQYIIWNNMDAWNTRMLLEKFYGWFVISAIFSYFFIRRDFIGLAIIGKWAFVFFLVTLVMTFIVLQLDSEIIRQSANPKEFSSFQERIFRITGSGGYGFVQSVVLFFPIIIGRIKSGGNLYFLNKRGMIGLLIFMSIVLLQAQFFANVLVAAFMTILAIVGVHKFKRSLVSLTLVFLLFALVPTKVYAQGLRSIATQFDTSTTIYAKFIDFSFFIEGSELYNETGAGDRVDRYPLLFEGLLASPLLGYASLDSSLNISAGGHLEWMNKLAQWGIPMFLVFVCIMFMYFKVIWKLFKQPFAFYYFLSLLAYFLMGLMKVTENRDTWLMLLIIIPGVYFAPLLQKNNKNLS